MRPCGYRLQSWQARDHTGGRRPAAKMAALQSAQRRRELVGRAVHCAPGLVMQPGFPGLSPVFRALTSAATARATLGRSKLRIADEASVRAGCSARVDLHRPLANVKVGIQIGLKAVLEHRAPKISPPILHTRCAESKVGRAVHCAPRAVAARTIPCTAPLIEISKAIGLTRTLPTFPG